MRQVTRLFFKSATAYIAYLAFSDCNVVILKFSRHLGGIFRLKDGLNDIELLNRFCVCVSCSKVPDRPGPAYSVSMLPFQDQPRMVLLVGVGLGVGLGGLPE